MKGSSWNDLRGSVGHAVTSNVNRQTKVQVLIDYGHDPSPYIYYDLYDTNGTLIDWVDEYPDAEEEDFYSKEYCLNSSKCYVMRFPNLGNDIFINFFYYANQ